MRIVIVHCLPIEYYPPTTNFLKYVSRQSGVTAVCISSKNEKGRNDVVVDNVTLHRLSAPLRYSSLVSRFCKFLRWHWSAARIVAGCEPDIVLYTEPHSAFAAFVYFRVFRGSGRLFVHHHEYYEPCDYKAKGNRLTRLNHFFEKRFLFSRAEWISQTNDRRLALFHADHPSINPAKLRVMANFPPASWRGRSKLAVGSWQLIEEASDEKREKGVAPHPNHTSPVGGPARGIRLVYVGSVSLHDTFIGPLVEWILAREDDAVTLDVFAYNADEKTKEFLREAGGGRREAGGELEQAGGWRLEAGGELEQAGGWRLEAGGCRLQTSGSGLPAPESPLPSPDSGLPTPSSGLTPPASRLKPAPRVRYFEQGVEYDRLPEVLANYDVGVILYRCNTTNYKFNASNKLFEYLACGLEVWFPPQMLGVKPYARDDAFPRVMEVDYEKLDTVDLEKMRDTQGLPDAPPPPCCEDEFEKLLAVMRGC